MTAAALADRGPVWSTAAREQQLWDQLPEAPVAGPRRSLVEGCWPGLVRPAVEVLPDGAPWPLYDARWPLITRGWTSRGETAALVGIDETLQDAIPLMRTGSSPDAMLFLGPGGRALLRGVRDGMGWILVAEGVRRWLGAEWERSAEPVAILGVPPGGEPALEGIEWPDVPIILDGQPGWMRRVRSALPAPLDVRGLR